MVDPRPGPDQFTVAVATYARPEALARCLAAIAAGTGLPGEVLVVDQAPSARAEEVVLTSGLPGARYLPQAKLGLSASRNLALRHATRRYLAVTDDDCAPDPGWLDALAAAFVWSPVPAAVTGSILALGPQPPGTYAVSLRSSDVVVDHAGPVAPWVVGSGANFATETARLRRMGGWDERLGTGSPGRAAEDSELVYRYLRQRLLVRYDPAAVIRHEWQTVERRVATRWSYGFGVGAFLGLCARRGDAFLVWMLKSYAEHHARACLAAARHGDRALAWQHWRGLVSLIPGFSYGLRVGRRRPQPPPVGR